MRRREPLEWRHHAHASGGARSGRSGDRDLGRAAARSRPGRHHGVDAERGRRGERAGHHPGQGRADRQALRAAPSRRRRALERIARHRCARRVRRQQLRPHGQGHRHRRNRAGRCDWPPLGGVRLCLRQHGSRRRGQRARGVGADQSVRRHRERLGGQPPRRAGADVPGWSVDGRRHHARGGRRPGPDLRGHAHHRRRCR